MIYFICPSDNNPSGGVRRIYRNVDLLNAAGLNAAVIHDRPDFRCTWFANKTRIMHRAHIQVSSREILVFPELFGSLIAEILPGMPRVILNQGAYLTFNNIPEGIDAKSIYMSPDVVVVAVVSEDSRSYLRYVFPDVIVRRLHLAVDSHLWHPPASPAPLAIGYMPRRRSRDVHQVIKILQSRGVLERWRLVPIDGVGEEDVAKRMRACALFLSMNQSEGFGLPPVEAMASGCHVIGFHGFGGLEYFRAPFCEEVPEGDVVSLARKVEVFLRSYEQDPAAWHRQALAGAAWVTSTYSAEKEVGDLVDCFQFALGKAAERPHETFNLDVRGLQLPGRPRSSRLRRTASRLRRGQ